MKRTAKIFFILIFFFIILIIANYFYFSFFSKKYLYDNIKNLKKNSVGLLLGTSPYTGKGYPNKYFRLRIEAAALLLKKHKIEYIIASGDNRMKFYNEPQKMKKYLIKLGVSPKKIILDNKGYRTFVSIKRCLEFFHEKKVTIISQKFHNERAIYIAKHFDMQAVAFNAGGYFNKMNLKSILREIFARVKAFLEINCLMDL